MTPSESNQDPGEEQMVTTADADNEGTAPDADTQSGAASEAGNRTAKGGSRAPNDPAEGE